jgi:nicotinamidase-related amidase
MKCALVLVDVQNDYFPGGRMELSGSLDAVLVANSVMADFRHAGMPVVHVQHISTKPTATFFLPGTLGAEIHESVKPTPDEKVIVKHYPNSFRETDLQKHLESLGVKRIVVLGMMTHMCIDTTVRAAFDLGYDIQVVSDGCATKSLSIGHVTVAAEDVQNSFLAAMNGTFCKVVTRSEIRGWLE